MKLKYTIAQPTSLSSEEIIKKILFWLDEEKYGLVSVTDSSVSFDDNRRIIVGSWEYARKVNNGIFTILKNGESIVTLEYCPIPVFEYLWVGIICAVFSIMGMIDKIYFAGFVTLPFWGQLIFKHYNLARKTKEMLLFVTDDL